MYLYFGIKMLSVGARLVFSGLAETEQDNGIPDVLPQVRVWMWMCWLPLWVLSMAAKSEWLLFVSPACSCWRGYWTHSDCTPLIIRWNPVGRCRQQAACLWRERQCKGFGCVCVITVTDLWLCPHQASQVRAICGLGWLHGSSGPFSAERLRGGTVSSAEPVRCLSGTVPGRWDEVLLPTSL